MIPPITLEAQNHSIIAIVPENISYGEVIRTKTDTRVKLRFNDGHVLTLKASDYKPSEFTELTNRIFGKRLEVLSICEGERSPLPLSPSPRKPAASDE